MIEVKSVNRNHKDLKERSFWAISFSIPEKPKNEIYLVEDLDYERSFDIQVIEGEGLRDDEMKELADFIVAFTQPEYYLLSCGESYWQKERFYKFLESNPKLKDTGYLRTLKDKEGGEHYYKILKRL